MTNFLLFYICLVAFLCILHSIYLCILYWRHRSDAAVKPDQPLNPLPRVTIQIPALNEEKVIERALESCLRIDYPQHLLQIQAIDNSSTDLTGEIIHRFIKKHEASFAGELSYIFKERCQGSKAATLNRALECATGEFILQIDADFVVKPDVFKKNIHHFSQKKLGLLQFYCGHLNRDESLLTKIQAIAIDQHMLFDQFLNCKQGLFFNFNGTAGIWRKSALTSVGGWSEETISEDLDTSILAKLEGWKFLFLKDYELKGELPNSLKAFKNQQQRWGLGGLQVLKLRLKDILKSPRLRTRDKLSCLYRMARRPLLEFNSLILLYLLLYSGWGFKVGGSSALFSLFLGNCVMGMVCFMIVFRSWREYSKLLLIPGMFLLFSGLFVNFFYFVLKPQKIFKRTEKTGTDLNLTRPRKFRFSFTPNRLAFIEVCLGMTMMLYGLTSFHVIDFNILAPALVASASTLNVGVLSLIGKKMIL